MVAVEPSLKVAVRRKVVPLAKKLLLVLSPANRWVVWPSVRGRVRVPLLVLASGASRPLAAPSAQLAVEGTVSQTPALSVRRSSSWVRVRLPAPVPSVRVKVPSGVPSGESALVLLPTRSRSLPR